MKTTFNLDSHTSTKDGVVNIIGTNRKDCNPYVNFSVLENGHVKFSGSLKDKDLKRFAENILKALA